MDHCGFEGLCLGLGLVLFGSLLDSGDFPLGICKEILLFIGERGRVFVVEVGFEISARMLCVHNKQDRDHSSLNSLVGECDCLLFVA